MRNRVAIPLAIGAAVVLVAVDYLICFLFDVSNLGALFLLPVPFVLVPLAAGILVWGLLRRSIRRRYEYLLIMGIMIVAFLVQLTIHPSRPHPWVEMYECARIVPDYPDNIVYDDLAFGNEREKVAAIVKYSDSLPDKKLILKINSTEDISDNPIEQYWAEIRDGSLVYDKSKFLLIESNNIVLFITDPDGPDRHEYHLERTTIENMINDFGVICPSLGEGIPAHICYYNSDFKYYKGAHKLFAKILSLKMRS